MKLQKSKVEFDPEEHRYTLDGLELSGITRLIHEHVMPNKYWNVPDDILAAAAERGNKIHSLCSTYNLFGDISEHQEVKNYAELLKENGIVIIKDEYLVDNGSYATRIDNVGSDCSLYDIKTTASLDKEYLSWQLSIGAHLFELQNPGLKVPALYGIWLRGEKAVLVEVERIPDEHILYLFDADTTSFKFENPLKRDTDFDLERIIQIESIICDLKDKIASLEGEKKLHLDTITHQMSEFNMKKLDTDRIVITRVLETTQKRFDVKKFKEEAPDLYAKYEVDTVRKGGVRIKLK